jgi:hypothetical protein
MTLGLKLNFVYHCAGAAGFVVFDGGGLPVEEKSRETTCAVCLAEFEDRAGATRVHALLPRRQPR